MSTQHRPMSRYPGLRAAVIGLIALVAVIVWLGVWHPFGHACVRETSPGAWVLVTASGDSVPLSGQARVQPVSCQP